MKKSSVIKKATNLRKKGYSFREISDKLHISKSTASLWVGDIDLSLMAKKRINKLVINGRKKGIETNRIRKEKENDLIRQKVEAYFLDTKRIEIDSRVACALLYWGEGAKYLGNKTVSFMNADPEMIRYFMDVFRRSFKIDEGKFRALLHLHEYHNAEKQISFWSDITKIPIGQFNKSYIKKNTGKNKKYGYLGCISIRYSDVRIYKELMFTIKELVNINFMRA